MPQMEALCGFKFAGRDIAIGERITATDTEAKTLRALRWAHPAKDYETRVQVAEEAAPGRKPRKARQQQDPNSPKRTYKRRDMQAET